jgi:hypothetical protein
VRAALLAQSELPDLSAFVEWDPTKECLATIEIRHDNPNDNRLRSERLAALNQYQTLARPLAHGVGARIVRSSYAIDVVPKGLSKSIGTRWVISAMLSRGPIKGPAWVLGDSPNDIEMLDALKASGVTDYRLCWLGAEAPPRIASTTYRPTVPFARGTMEFLDGLVAEKGTGREHD